VTLRRCLGLALALLAAAGLSPAGAGTRHRDAAPPPSAAASVPAATPAAHPPAYVEQRIDLPVFGRATVYRPDPVERTRGVVLFVSGDGGWKLGVVDMARRTADRTIVVGLSMPAWQKAVQSDPGRCWFPAGELESVAQRIEKMYHLPRYLKPILVGYSSGATVVYGVLAQGPRDAFAGAVSLGFCPDLEVARPFCSRNDWRPEYDARKRTSLLPTVPDLAPRPGGAPRWIVLQGGIDKVCGAAATARFVEAVPAARLVPLPKVGHGFGVARHWGVEYDRAIDAMLPDRTAWDPPPEPLVRPGRAPEQIRRRIEALDLPLDVEWPAGAETVVIFISGDGGWAELDQKVTAGLVERGVAVIGWNALRYFWERKPEDRFRADLARVVAAIPDGLRIYAGGYSFGAEVTPVAVGPGAPPTTGPLERLAGLVLLAPGPYADFEVSPLDWLRSREAPTRHPVREAIDAAAARMPVLCIEPSDQKGSGCPQGKAAALTRVTLDGGHHFHGDFDGLAARIARFVTPPE
jgi:type IV secretory pathway VirJ component